MRDRDVRGPLRGAGIRRRPAAADWRQGGLDPVRGRPATKQGRAEVTALVFAHGTNASHAAGLRPALPPD
jgi:hypothetical protein